VAVLQEVINIVSTDNTTRYAKEFVASVDTSFECYGANRRIVALWPKIIGRRAIGGKGEGKGTQRYHGYSLACVLKNENWGTKVHIAQFLW